MRKPSEMYVFVHATYRANPCPEHLFRNQITFRICFAIILLGLSALRAPTVGPLKCFDHKTTFPDTHRHFQSAIGGSRKVGLEFKIVTKKLVRLWGPQHIIKINTLNINSTIRICIECDLFEFLFFIKMGVWTNRDFENECWCFGWALYYKLTFWMLLCDPV